ncbi:hypothetical protein [Saccharopolyspora shandongensis]|uniref:hypothetical protein n=1 Tax=Saccharopolyspora shandongensis TaxID=418495 RepID=UPI0033CB9F11
MEENPPSRAPRTRLPDEVPAGQNSYEVAAWPAGEPVKGSAPYATQIVQSAGG